MQGAGLVFNLVMSLPIQYNYIQQKNEGNIHTPLFTHAYLHMARKKQHSILHLTAANPDTPTAERLLPSNALLGETFMVCLWRATHACRIVLFLPDRREAWGKYTIRVDDPYSIFPTARSLRRC